jgi:hypothetical protein
VVFVDADNRYGTTLAHEIGHVLLGAELPDYGHSSVDGAPKEGFNRFNLMLDFVDSDLGTPRDHLTLGQVFRIAVDDMGWLNLSGVRDGEKKDCPIPGDATTDTQECPKLTHDIYQVVVRKNDDP